MAAPTVTSFKPDDGATQGSRSVEMTVTSAKDMDPATLIANAAKQTSTTVQLFPISIKKDKKTGESVEVVSKKPVKALVSYDEEGWTVTLIPSKPLKANTKHKVVIREGRAASRTRRFPGITFRGPEHDRRAWILGTALDVWQVVEAYEDMGLGRLLEEGDLPERFVKLALAYYEEYPGGIDEAIALNRRSQAELHALYPTLVPAPEEE